eukprot:1569265-Rhodomonas_salina.1
MEARRRAGSQDPAYAVPVSHTPLRWTRAGWHRVMMSQTPGPRGHCQLITSGPGHCPRPGRNVSRRLFQVGKGTGRPDLRGQRTLTRELLWAGQDEKRITVPHVFEHVMGVHTTNRVVEL